MVNYFRRAHLPYRQAVEHGILTVRAADGGRSLEFFRTEDPRYPEATELVRWVMARGGADALCELYVVGRFLAEGPKFFAFDARTCEALEQFSLALPARDYAQPFPTLLIRLPPDYAQDRVAPFAHLGRAGTHTPDWIFVRHDQATGRVLILTHMTSDTYLTKSLCTNQDESLEAAWEEAHRVRSDDSPSSLPVTPGEIELNHAMSRLALATCLLLLVYGTKRVGPDNPSHGDRLKRHLDRARKSRDTGRIALAAWDLDTLPVRYAFAQEVVLYRRERQEQAAGPGEPTGRDLAPHWRRDFLKMQPYGPGNTNHDTGARAAGRGLPPGPPEPGSGPRQPQGA